MSMNMQKFAYHNTGGMMSWKDGPPYQSKAADTQGLSGLGSLGNPTISLPMPLPRPGAPEPLEGDCGCGCGGGGGCAGSMGDTTVDLTPLLYVGLGFVLAKIFSK